MKDRWDDIEPAVHDLLDGKLAPAEERALRERIGRNPEHARRLSELETVVRGLAEFRKEQAPAGFADRVLAALDRQESAPPGSAPPAARRFPPRLVRWLMPIAAVLLGSFLVHTMLDDGPGRGETGHFAKNRGKERLPPPAETAVRDPDLKFGGDRRGAVAGKKLEDLAQAAPSPMPAAESKDDGRVFGEQDQLRQDAPAAQAEPETQEEAVEADDRVELLDGRLAADREPVGPVRVVRLRRVADLAKRAKGTADAAFSWDALFEGVAVDGVVGAANALEGGVADELRPSVEALLDDTAPEQTRTVRIDEAGLQRILANAARQGLAPFELEKAQAPAAGALAAAAEFEESRNIEESKLKAEGTWRPLAAGEPADADSADGAEKGDAEGGRALGRDQAVSATAGLTAPRKIVVVFIVGP